MTKLKFDQCTVVAVLKLKQSTIYEHYNKKGWITIYDQLWEKKKNLWQLNWQIQVKYICEIELHKQIYAWLCVPQVLKNGFNGKYYSQISEISRFAMG